MIQKGFLHILRPIFLALHQAKNWFRNLKLHWKIQILVFSVILVAFSVSLLLFNYFMKAYDEQLYMDSANILSLSTQNIENEMHDLLNTVSQLSTDKTNQEIIRSIENASSEYDEYTNRQSLIGRIYMALRKNTYILSVNFIDPNLRIDSVGSDTSIVLGSKAQALYDTAFSQNGKPVWATPDSEDDAIILLSPIKEVEHLSLRPMGVLAIRLRMPKMVEFTMDIDTAAGERFYIYSGDYEIYHSQAEQDEFCPALISGSHPYQIIDIGEESRFVVSKQSGSSSWMYYYSISYNAIFARFNKLKIMVLVIFPVMYLLLVLIAAYFSTSLTKPLTKLTKQMEGISKVNFETSNLSFSQNSRKDEIGQLQESFYLMIKKIETLIQDDYVRRLMMKDYEFRTLQAQINPHFIYNTLDSIYWMALNQNQSDISTMIFSLGKLLRETIKYGVNFQKLVSLRDEIMILDHYLNIQKIRFREKLDFQKELSDDSLDCMVPKLILQPLVENSISYGVESTAYATSIILTAHTEDDCLIITIQDNGIGIEHNLMEKLATGERKPNGSGVGLSNIQSRLKIIYGSNSCLNIENIHPHGTIVTLNLPIT